MTLTWYNCSDDTRVINKTLTNETEGTCQLYGTCSLDTPVLKVKAVKGNYVKLNDKYYYVTEERYTDGYFLITCKIDVLKTYETEILNSTQLIERSENYGNMSLADSNIPLNSRYQIEGYPFGSEVTTNDTSYILGVI